MSARSPRPGRGSGRGTRAPTRSAFDRVLEVRLADRPVPLVVGRLAQRGHDILFEYDDAFIPTGLVLSPLGLPLRAGVQQETTRIFHGLHGLFHDSLPDGWGLRLMDREFSRRGFDPATVTPVERLQFLGTRPMGGLTYHPAADAQGPAPRIDLDVLGAQAERVYEGSPEEVLPALVKAGGSAAGARPKVLVAWNTDSGEMRSGAEDVAPGFKPYLVKFPTKEDGADVGAVEMAYAAMARAAGIDMPATHLFSTDGGRRCFGVERFDRVHTGKTAEHRHVHTLGGLLHASHREVGCTYSHFLRATARLTHDHREVLEAFRRMVFNVLAWNRDDHVRNFAFLMEPSGTWRLAPAYDLVYSPGPGGEHSMMVGTEGARPTYQNFLQVAAPEGLTPRDVADIVERAAESVLRWPAYAVEYGVAPATTEKINASIQRACADGMIRV